MDISLLDGGNHFFSLNGEITYNSIAFNGCSKNPIFIDKGMLRHYDGTEIKREDLTKCFTREGGKEKVESFLTMLLRRLFNFLKSIELQTINPLSRIYILIENDQ